MTRIAKGADIDGEAAVMFTNALRTTALPNQSIGHHYGRGRGVGRGLGDGLTSVSEWAAEWQSLLPLPWPWPWPWQ